uniref:Phosphoadenosine phosphosulphate reductase domain-containing protein n=1 Tax=Geoglobus ahangari TaxID=113653 RepID=A0A7C4S5M1_9EURY
MLMIVAIARAKKDAKALSHALNCKVMSLGGVRSVDDVDLSVLEDSIPIFFFGRSEAELAEEVEKEIRKITEVYNVVVLNKKSVRNARLEEIRRAFEIAKAKIRLGIDLDDVFRFSVSNGFGVEIHPDYDEYFIIGREFVNNLLKLGVNAEEGSLVLRKLYNEEHIFVPEHKAIIYKRIGNDVSAEIISQAKPKKFEIERLIEKNKDFLKTLERISIKFIQQHGEDAVVPFSGGKDSLSCLILAKKALGSVKAVYIKTNYDMPLTEEYVDYVCDKLDVELITEKVYFDVAKYGMPTHENRWCTNLKIKALHKATKNAKTIIVGDRDAESRLRRLRPEVLENSIKEIFPIKYWSGAMVQLYILMNGLELHPLYLKGFYRLGCTICPSLSEWEKWLLNHNFY